MNHKQTINPKTPNDIVTFPKHLINLHQPEKHCRNVFASQSVGMIVLLSGSPPYGARHLLRSRWVLYHVFGGWLTLSLDVTTTEK